MTTTKKDLALHIAKETGSKKSLASKMVDIMFQRMRDSLISGDRIEIRGFGVFQVKDTRPKPAARNPRTGDVIYVPERRKTQFRPGKFLKDALHQPLEIPKTAMPLK
jgi:integration host factor subunit beta